MERDLFLIFNSYIVVWKGVLHQLDGGAHLRHRQQVDDFITQRSFSEYRMYALITKSASIVTTVVFNDG